MMPEPTSKASEPRASTETGPPVSGRADTDAEAEALAVAVGLADGLAVEEGDAVASGEAHPGLPSAKSGLRQSSSPSKGLSCAIATEANSSVPIIDRPINSNSFLKVPLP